MRARALAARAERHLRRTLRRLRRVERRVVSLEPAGEPVGAALLSYILDPFLLPPGRPAPHSHTHFWESLTIGRTLRDLGFSVDVIHWTNLGFTPRRGYSLVIDVRLNLARLAPLVGPSCLKVLHAETAHPGFNNPAHLRRLEELEERRGIELAPRTLIEDRRAVEHADCATVLGNDFTQGTYRFAGKPLYRVPISQPLLYPFPEDKDFRAAARRFVWFGSQGFVHKGLDRVLETFAGLPDLHLTVCGPVDREPDFERAFRRELFRTPNIETAGWVDVSGERFRRITGEAVATVYPSCSEGGGGAVITCMHAGLVPVVTREASVDVPEGGGVVLPDASLDALREAVVRLSERPPEALEAMTRRAWEHARAAHTRESFAAGYRRALLEILARFRPELRERLRA